MTVNGISPFRAVFRDINIKYINNIPIKEHASLSADK